MSTRAYIARERKAGELEFIYNHYDGDPEYLGRILKRCYRTRDKVETLLQGGDISYIRERPDLIERARGGKPAEVMPERRFRNLLASRTLDYVYLFRRGRWTAFDAEMNEIEIP